MHASNPSLHSIPSRARSCQFHTQSTPPASRPQSKLMETMAREIGDQTYEFEPDVVAQMLSPKLPKLHSKIVNRDIRPTLGDFECLIDEPTVQDAMQRVLQPEYTSPWHTSEADNYASMAAFLTKCVTHCDVIYGEIHEKLPQDNRFKVATQTERWLPQLCFIKYNKPTGDGTQNSNALKPDIIGLNGHKATMQETSEILGWWDSPPAETNNQGKRNYQIIIPVEMKDSWPKMVKQAATYARSQFGASPLRSFVPVIAVNHIKQDLRFLIFHHGGLSASKALKLDNTGCHAVRKILLSILLWQSAEDAGFPTFIDGPSYHLSSETDIGGVWTIKQKLHHLLCIRGRSTYVISLERMENGAEKTTSTKFKDHHLTIARLSRIISRETCSTRIRSNKLEFTDEAKKHNPDTAQKSHPALSNSWQPQETAADSRKRDVDEATLDPAPHCEKRHCPLAKARPLKYVSVHGTNPPLLSTIVLKCSWPNEARECVEPKMYETCGNAFGTPQVLCSFVPCFRENYPMCNSIFLPPKGEEPNKYHWAIFNEDHEKPKIPKAIDLRTLWITVLVDEGYSLDGCSDALDLRECLLHSMIGWLSTYQHGYLHRDISIGNLLKLENPVSRRPFNALEFTKLIASRDEKKELDKSGLNDETVFQFIERKKKNNSECMELLGLAQELNQNLNKAWAQCGSPTKCKSIIVDGDLAAYIPDYFDSPHHTGSFSGTAEFMSYELLRAWEDQRPYLHSPLDDLWSFFWTALWATLHNCNSQTQCYVSEKRWRTMLRDEGPMREGVATAIRNDYDINEANYSPILVQMKPLLRSWFVSLTNRTHEWMQELTEARKEAHPGEETAGRLHLLFHKIAYSGVLDFVTIYNKTNGGGGGGG